MNIEKNFDKKMLDVLRASGHIKHIMLDDVLEKCDSEEIRKLLNVPKLLSLKDDGLFYSTEAGDLEKCPTFGANISDDGRWLSSKIPSVSFDVDQGGNLRKGEEAEAAYCCAIVCLVVSDEIFSIELDSVINNYNYTTFDGLEGGSNFKELLTSWQNLQSVTVNVCVSAAKYNITDIKKDTEMFLRTGIQEDLVIELRSLDTKIKDINRNYSTGVLSPVNIRTLTKIEILQKLEDKNVEIQKNINESSVELLYKIFKLNSEYISPIVKKRLSSFAQIEADKLFKDGVMMVSYEKDKKKIVDKWKKRFFRMELTSVKKIQVEKYLESPDTYVLPVKL